MGMVCFRGACGFEIPQSIDTKFGIDNYVGDGTRHGKIRNDRPSDGFLLVRSMFALIGGSMNAVRQWEIGIQR